MKILVNRRRSRWWVPFACAAICVALGVLGINAWLRYSLGPPHPVTHAKQVRTATPQIMAAGDDTVVSTKATARVVALATTAKPSKAAAFDLLAKGGPASQFSAYKLVDDCLTPAIVVRFNNDPRNFEQGEAPEALPAPDHDANCGDLNAQQLTDTDTRLAVLVPAVKAGVKGAWIKFVLNEGPSGILSRETGPGSLSASEYASIKAEGLNAAIDHADPAALARQLDLLERSGSREDRIKALEYRVAIVTNGPMSDVGLKPLDPTGTPGFKRVSEGLDQATIDAAVKRGEELARKVIR